jgi:hypothetical protein
MTEKPKKETKEPAPRPPRQPDLSLITYLERGRDPKSVETRPADPRPADEDEGR